MKKNLYNALFICISQTARSEEDMDYYDREPTVTETAIELARGKKSMNDWARRRRKEQRANRGRKEIRTVLIVSLITVGAVAGVYFFKSTEKKDEGDMNTPLNNAAEPDPLPAFSIHREAHDEEKEGDDLDERLARLSARGGKSNGDLPPHRVWAFRRRVSESKVKKGDEYIKSAIDDLERADRADEERMVALRFKRDNPSKSKDDQTSWVIRSMTKWDDPVTKQARTAVHRERVTNDLRREEELVKKKLKEFKPKKEIEDGVSELEAMSIAAEEGDFNFDEEKFEDAVTRPAGMSAMDASFDDKVEVKMSEDAVNEEKIKIREFYNEFIIYEREMFIGWVCESIWERRKDEGYDTDGRDDDGRDDSGNEIDIGKLMPETSFDQIVNECIEFSSEKIKEFISKCYKQNPRISFDEIYDRYESEKEPRTRCYLYESTKDFVSKIDPEAYEINWIGMPAEMQGTASP